jgi:D-2-hydroxyacid dehydrogenase (NADP+)
MEILIIKPSTNLQDRVTKQHEQQIKKLLPSAKIKHTVSDSAELSKLLKSAEIIITQRLNYITTKAAPKLRWVHLSSAGVNGLHNDLINSNVLITNSSGVHPIQISEHVLALMLMLIRGIHRSFRYQLQKKWVRGEGLQPIDELAGKTVSIIGMGAIGERVAMLCKAFEMKVIGVVRNANKKRPFVDELAGNSDLPKVVAHSDFVVNCLPGTPETNHIFEKGIFAKFKKGSFFINIGRGTTVKEEDLIQALQNGKLEGAGLDVFETEPLPKESKLWNLENVIITPHYSGWSPHYGDRMIEIFCRNLESFLKKQKMPTLIDKSLGY